MKVAFLDIDGVLNSKFWNNTHTKEISDCTLVDEQMVQLFGQFVSDTGVRVVLHSAWRFMFDKNLKPKGKKATRLYEMLKAVGVEFYDFTPDLTDPSMRITKAYSRVKAYEILLWLSRHSDIEGWVVFEDLDLGNAVVSAHQVKTDNNVGLTNADICKAKQILKAK